MTFTHAAAALQNVFAEKAKCPYFEDKEYKILEAIMHSSSGQERSEGDIRATLEDIYTTWGDVFFHMKNAINFQKII